MNNGVIRKDDYKVFFTPTNGERVIKKVRNMILGIVLYQIMEMMLLCLTVAQMNMLKK